MKTILVADDDNQMRKLLRSAFEAQGYRVAEASNGQEAMQMFTQQRPDLLIIDIIMPVQEGIETITEVIAQDPTVKIIAISGGGRISPKSYLKLAKQLGAVHALEKPLNIKDLVKRVASLLGS